MWVWIQWRDTVWILHFYNIILWSITVATTFSFISFIKGPVLLLKNSFRPNQKYNQIKSLLKSKLQPDFNFRVKINLLLKRNVAVLIQQWQKHKIYLQSSSCLKNNRSLNVVIFSCVLPPTCRLALFPSLLCMFPRGGINSLILKNRCYAQLVSKWMKAVNWLNWHQLPHNSPQNYSFPFAISNPTTQQSQAGSIMSIISGCA